MVKHTALPFLILLLVLSAACNRQSAPAAAAWKPTALPVFNAQLIPTRLNESILADLVTSVLLNKPETQNLGQVIPLREDAISAHPQFGPFLFSSGETLIVVADTENRFSEQSVNLRTGTYTEAWFIALLPTPEAEQILVSNKVKSIPYAVRPRNSIAAQNGKIILTPENMVATLSAFSQWEGVHLDREKGELTFVGSNAVSNPQISASDLITAYRAIYEHEAFGEPLFVDMDFNEKQDNYLVTFGGGFEDTRPGRVLYEADLLLKGLSSGIDPFSTEKPLIEIMCGSSSQTAFQRVLCKYILPSIKSSNHRNFINIFKEETSNYIKNKEMGRLIIALSREAEGEKSYAWEHVFFASKAKQEDIITEISTKGYFTFIAPSMVQEMKQIRRLFDRLTPQKKILVMEEMAKQGLSFDMPTGCGCVLKPWKFELNDCETDCDSASTKKRVEAINHLTKDQKSIVLEAREFTSLTEEEKELYATLAFSSPKIHAFLRGASTSSLTKLFSVIKEMEENMQTGEEEALIANLAMLFFMSENTGFLQEYLNLNKNDQLTLAYLTSGIMLDEGFAKMLYELQFHQPLCYADRKIPIVVNSFQDAYRQFVCRHLSKFSRTYLADLIRKELKGSFAYFSTSEPSIEEYEYDESADLSEVQKIRYWFFPGNEVLTLASENQLNTFLFNRPNMKAQAENIETRNGPFESVDTIEYMPGITENLRLINDHYDELAEIFPTLKELNNLVRMLAFFRWIRYYQSNIFDLEAFANATDLGTPTPRTYPVYETVVALPNGALMRAIGGVDIHSATQIGFNPSKINGFIKAMYAAREKSSFVADGKTYIVNPIVSKTTGMPEAHSAKFGNQHIDVSTTRFSHSISGKLVWSSASETDVFLNEQSIFNLYAPDQSERLVYTLGDSLAKQFTFLYKDFTTKFDKQIVAPTVREQHLKDKLEELGASNAPADVLWSLFSIPFKDAKMTAAGQEHLYLYKIDSLKTVRWLGKRDATGYYTIHEISEKEEQAWLNQVSERPNIGNSSSTKFVGIRLSSTVPAANLIISDLGYRNDSLLQVEVWGSRHATKSIFEWRRMLADEAIPTYWEKDKQSNIILTPNVFERKKGDFISNDLTSRAFLIESIANLRYKSWKSPATKNHYAFIREQPTNEQMAEPVKVPWDKYAQRVFVIDTLGFNPESRKELLELVIAYPNSVFTFSPEKMPALLQNEQNRELIWISGLSEEEIQNRLELAQLNGWLNSVHRIRVFNVNNSVFDLSNNLFVDLPQLRSIGAWSRILDFDSVLPLLKALIKSPAGKELDVRIAELVKEIQGEYGVTAPPYQQQIARNLQEALYSWEEIRPFDKSNLNWKNY